MGLSFRKLPKVKKIANKELSDLMMQQLLLQYLKEEDIKSGSVIINQTSNRFINAKKIKA